MRRPVVLVAEDSTTVRGLLRRSLAEHGYAVVEAQDGVEALGAMRTSRPDVVILDVEMPNLDGRQVLAAVQADPQLRPTPIIVLTHRDSVEDMVAALDGGAVDFLHKPFHEPELMARVGAAARTSALQAELRRRNEELEAFASRASHDLKSPLSVVRGMADTLVDAWDRLRPEQRGELLQSISVAAQRAATMVSDLLTLARSDVAPDPAAAAAVSTDPEQVVRDAIARALLRDGDEVSLSGTWAPVRMPGPELGSVVGNLVDNARHYGRSPDGRLRLMVRGEAAAASVRLVVEDQGPGIPDSAVEGIFEPFARLPTSSQLNPQSTGIGLAIVRRGVERWGGDVGVERGASGGARFVVTLPRALTQAP